MKILRLVSSFRGKDSQSFQLGNLIIERLSCGNEITAIVTRDLVKTEMPHFNNLHFTSFITPKNDLSTEQREAVMYSDNAIQELVDADIVVIEVPMYNFTIPSSLKSWIDHIVRAGTTFRYTSNGVEGLIKGKRVFLAISSGGIYTDGPMKDFDFTEKYLKSILGFIGLTDISTFRVEGIAIPGVQETALEKAANEVEKNITF